MTLDLKNHLAMRGNPCRHYLGFKFNGGSECARGRNLRRLFYKKYGNEAIGYLLKTPCNGSPEPFCNCPDIDVRTDAEVAEKAAKDDAATDKFVALLPKIQKIKAAMIEDGKAAAIYICPNCFAKTLHVRCNIGGNKHVHGGCSECKFGFLE